jgi:Ran GTPase-activating protein (RanGAP) involved in mRNA processing and transport
MRVLADYLEHSKTLKQLFLNDNKLSFEALESLSESLCINRSLTTLNLGNCGISDDMLSPLLATLSVNENLESLHVWGNCITEEGAELFLEVLKQHNHTLTDLQIFNNPIENYEDFLEVAFIQVLKALLRENATSPADKRNSSIEQEASEVVEEKVE